MVTLTYAILTHNEGEYIAGLLKRLTSFISNRNIPATVVIVDDNSTDAKTQMLLRGVQEKFSFIKVYQKKHNGDFSEQKNFLNSMCKGDWIFNLDADEFVEEEFLEILPTLIESNPEIEAYYIPRINTVDGLTESHVRDWKWNVQKFESMKHSKPIKEFKQDELNFLRSINFVIKEENEELEYYVPIVMWPDFQMRLYKNSPNIKWVNRVHEKLSGFRAYAMIPPQEEYAIRHFKDIKRQELQNKLYDEISNGDIN